MSTIRLVALVLILSVVATLTPAAAPPTPLPIARWIEDLGSEDDATWRKANDNLWRAGEKALPALRAAAKHTDPDVVLRARLVLAKLEWGIRPDTPAAVVAEIERYRDGDTNQKKAAVTQLLRQGRDGYLTLRVLLARETNAEVKQEIAQRLKELIRPAVRDHIVRGELGDAEKNLAAAADSGSADALRDLTVFLVLTGKAEKVARELEVARKGSETIGDDAKRAAYLRRALGDLKAARRNAEQSPDKALLGGILDELEDYKALAKLDLPEFKLNRHRAALLHRAGDRDGFESAMQGEMTPQELAAVYLFNGRPRQGIEAALKHNPASSVCVLLSQQGRYREALAVAPTEHALAPATPAFVLLEQALLSSQMGDKENSRKLVERALALAEKVKTHDAALGKVLKTGVRGGWLDDAVADVGKILDAEQNKKLSDFSLRELAGEDYPALSSWWDYLRKARPNDASSAFLRLLADWFVKGKADADFDATVAAARKYQDFVGNQKESWHAAVARACVKVGKLKLAEEILKEDADNAATVKAHTRYGELLFDAKRWEDAAAAYEKAVKIDPTAAAPLYLRGAALVKAGKEEGKTLIERARLLPLGEEAVRYALADELTKRGLPDEAEAERQLIVRTAAFRSIYASNAASALGNRLAQRKRYFEAAWCYRRLLTNVAFSGGGSFTDDRAYLLVPGWAHLFEARGLLAAGKPDAALAEARRMWEYLPQDMTIVPDLVRALEKADRKADADRLFAEKFALLQRASVEAPKFADRHNRLAWLAARSGRRLDTALQHAKRATELTPKSPVPFDTLAEVQFQRGEKDEAVKAIKEAIKLATKVPYYAAQLKRIEAGDPKAEVPPR